MSFRIIHSATGGLAASTPRDALAKVVSLGRSGVRLGPIIEYGTGALISLAELRRRAAAEADEPLSIPIPIAARR
jgi:hypothetical protein